MAKGTGTMESGTSREGKAGPPGQKLHGRVAIVTGAARGIGKAIARRLGSAGAAVAVADIDVRGAAAVAEEMVATGGRAVAVDLDVTAEASVRSMVDSVVGTQGRIDILVNNAGILFRTRLAEITAEEWRATMAVNLDGAFLCTKAVVPLMKARKHGRIVNVSSSAGRSVSTLGGAHYTASKAGLLGLTRAAARELAPHGITVNAVCPGLIDTRMARETTTPEEMAGFVRSFPVGRLGTSDEVADLVVFLASDAAGYVTGASIDINGGDLML